MSVDATATTVTERIISSPPPVYYHGFGTVATDNIEIFRELNSLLTLAPSYNGSRLQACPDAYENAKKYLENATNEMTIPPPEFTPDGEGGIDIEWERLGRRLALSCRASERDRDFISWREPNGRYDGRHATQHLLNQKLDWLTS
jgi:hypothetical protein